MIPANCIRGTGKMPFAREVFVGENYAPDDSGDYALALNSTGAKLPDGVVVCEAAINKPESAGEVIALEFFNSSTSDVVVLAKTAAAVLVKAPTMSHSTNITRSLSWMRYEKLHLKHSVTTLTSIISYA